MWSKYQTSIVVGISLSILFSMFWFVQSLALVIFISVLLTILLNSAVDKLETKKVPRVVGAAIVLFSFLALISFFLVMLSRTFIPNLANFIADIPKFAEDLKNLPLFELSAPVTDQLEEVFKGFASFSVTALKSSLSVIISLFSKFLDLVIIIFVTFYLLKDGRSIKAYLAGLFPAKDNVRILQLFHHILSALSNYIHGQLVICLLTGIFVFFYFSIRDLPYASVFAVLSAVGEFIPVVGPTVASAFGTLLSVTQSPLLGAQTLLFYVVLTQVNHNIIYPYLIGKSLNLHPIAIMLGILFGGEILGALGMFLAVPCMVIIKLVLEDINHHRTHSS